MGEDCLVVALLWVLFGVPLGVAVVLVLVLCWQVIKDCWLNLF